MSQRVRPDGSYRYRQVGAFVVLEERSGHELLRMRVAGVSEHTSGGALSTLLRKSVFGSSARSREDAAGRKTQAQLHPRHVDGRPRGATDDLI